MPKPAAGYAGFSSLTDYLNQRMQRDGLSRTRLSRAIGKDKNYISCVCATAERPPQFSPGPGICDLIAETFHDDPHIVRVLAGREAPPPDGEARAIADKISRLPKSKRELAVKFVDFLLWEK